VFLSTWYELPPVFGSQGEIMQCTDEEFWGRVLVIREQVSRQLERLRETARIGSSLDAEVDLYVDAETARLLGALEDELRFVFITSAARVHPLEERPAEAFDAGSSGMPLWIQVRASGFAKCVRCWHHRADVGSDRAHPEICARCVENVAGAGEVRRYA
jgi:isoleucyl-tRNA synthetase